MEKGSLLRISIALVIICVYIYLFGIMGTIESIELSLPQETVKEEVTAPAVTFDVDENGKVQYTYATEINVINARKPALYDYTRTQAQLIIPQDEEIPEVSAAEQTTTIAADFDMDADDFDYVIPTIIETTLQTLPPETTAYSSADTTRAPVYETTKAQTSQTVRQTAATAQSSNTAPRITLAEYTEPVEEAAEDTAQAAAQTTGHDDRSEDDEDDEDDEIYDIDDLDDDTREEESAQSDADTTQPPDYEEPSDDQTEQDDTEPEETSPADTQDADDADDTQEYDGGETEEEPDEEEEREEEHISADDEIFTVNAGGTIITDSAFNIVCMAVMAEINDIFDEEAIKAQAIATYTYIKYYNLNNQNAYIAKATPSEKLKRIVREVFGKAIYYDGKVIQAVYTASTAGRAASSKTVWGIDFPYLKSHDTSFIDEPYDINYGRTAVFSSDEIKDAVYNTTGIVLSGDPADWIKIESHTDEIFVGQMSLGGYTTYNNGSRDVNITGRVFRETILDYNIRSTCFTVEYDKASDSFTFTTFGYGHCVGFSQHGANILATYFDYDYEDILHFYYKDVEIK